MTIPPLLVSVKKVWAKGNHAAFSDLSYHSNEWFLAFREGKDHVKSGHGKIRILASGGEEPDQFTSRFELMEEGLDLRDPKITLHPSGSLFLIAGIVELDQKGDPSNIQTGVALGKNFSTLQRVYKEGFWIWRITWVAGYGYGVAYPLNKESAPELVRTSDGIEFEKIIEFDFPMTEATIRRVNGGFSDTLALVGRVRNEKAMLGFAKPPYTDWQFLKTGFDLHGPDMITFSTSEILLGGRILYQTPYGRIPQCALIDKQEMNLKRELLFPGGGDTGYPSFLFHNGFLWVSYHSGQGNLSDIYLAKVMLGDHN